MKRILFLIVIVFLLFPERGIAGNSPSHFFVSDVWSQSDVFGQNIIGAKIIDITGAATPIEGTIVWCRVNLPNGKVWSEMMTFDNRNGYYFSPTLNTNSGHGKATVFAKQGGASDLRSEMVKIF